MTDLNKEGREGAEWTWGGQVFQAEGKPVQAPEVGACCTCSRGGKEAGVGGLEGLRRVKGAPDHSEDLTPVPSLCGTPQPAPATPLMV